MWPASVLLSHLLSVGTGYSTLLRRKACSVISCSAASDKELSHKEAESTKGKIRRKDKEETVISGIP